MLIARRNLMAGKSLPYDAEVDYLESTGTQYIDTGIYGSLNNTIIDLSFRVEQLSSQKIFGARTTSTQEAFAIYYDSKNQFTINCGNEYRDAIVDILGNVVVKNEIVDESTTKYTVNNDITFSRTRFNQTTQMPLLLFAYYNGTQVATSGSLKFFYAKISDDISILDLVPVRFTNENGVSEGAMYNRLGVGGMNPDGTLRTDGLYRNRGTGAFGWKELNGIVVPPQ